MKWILEWVIEIERCDIPEENFDKATKGDAKNILSYVVDKRSIAEAEMVIYDGKVLKSRYSTIYKKE